MGDYGYVLASSPDPDEKDIDEGPTVLDGVNVGERTSMKQTADRESLDTALDL